MSGPKAYSYRVNEAALRAQREAARLASEQNRLTLASERLRQEWLAASNEYEAVGAPPKLGAPGGTALSQAEFAARLGAARAELEETIRKEQQASMLAAIANVLAGDGPTLGLIDGERAIARALSRVAEKGEDPRESVAREVADGISRNLARIPAGATVEERARISELAENLLSGTDAPYATARLDGLRAAVVELGRVVRERDERNRCVDAALARLSALDPRMTEAAIAAVQECRGGSGSLPRNVEDKVREAEELAKKEEERAYVSDVLAEALAGLGYEVGPSFSDQIDSTGFADVKAPAWQGYAVRVRSGQPGGRLTFNVVRGEGEVDRHRDAEVESAWCSAVPQMVNVLAAAGIEADRVAAVSAGAQPVQVDPSLPSIASRATAARAGRERRIDEP